MSDELIITDGKTETDTTTHNDSTSIESDDIGVSSSFVAQKENQQNETSQISDTYETHNIDSQQILPSSNIPKITLSSLGIQAHTPEVSENQVSQEDANNSSPFKIQKDESLIINKDRSSESQNEGIENTLASKTEDVAIEKTSPLENKEIQSPPNAVQDSTVKTSSEIQSPQSGPKLITLESLQPTNPQQEQKPATAEAVVPVSEKKEEKEIFRNYESTFHSRKSTILMQLKKMRQIAKTNMVFIIFSILITAIGVYGLSYTDGRIHNYQNYKANVQGNYNIFANMVGLPTVVVDAPKLQDVIGVVPIGTHSINDTQPSHQQTNLPISATPTANQNSQTGATTTQKPKQQTKYNPYVIPESKGEKAQITKEILKDYFSN